jgi:hypothetical protein
MTKGGLRFLAKTCLTISKFLPGFGARGTTTTDSKYVTKNSSERCFWGTRQAEDVVGGGCGTFLDDTGVAFGGSDYGAEW